LSNTAFYLVKSTHLSATLEKIMISSY